MSFINSLFSQSPLLAILFGGAAPGGIVGAPAQAPGFAPTPSDSFTPNASNPFQLPVGGTFTVGVDANGNTIFTPTASTAPAGAPPAGAPPAGAPPAGAPPAGAPPAGSPGAPSAGGAGEQVPIYNENGDVVGYRQVDPQDAEGPDGDSSARNSDGGSSARNSDGDSSARNSDGDSSARNSDGDSSARNSDGDSSARNSDGDSSARNSDGGSSARNSDGGSSARNSDGDSSARNSDGDSSARNSDGDSSARNSDGDSSARNSDGDSSARNSDGDSSARNSDGDSSARNSDGDSSARNSDGGSSTNNSDGDSDMDVTPEKALETLQDNKFDFNAGDDDLLTKSELRETAKDEDASDDVRETAKYLTSSEGADAYDNLVKETGNGAGINIKNLDDVNPNELPGGKDAVMPGDASNVDSATDALTTLEDEDLQKALAENSTGDGYTKADLKALAKGEGTFADNDKSTQEQRDAAAYLVDNDNKDVLDFVDTAGGADGLTPDGVFGGSDVAAALDKPEELENAASGDLSADFEIADGKAAAKTLNDPKLRGKLTAASSNEDLQTGIFDTQALEQLAAGEIDGATKEQEAAAQYYLDNDAALTELDNQSGAKDDGEYLFTSFAALATTSTVV